MEKIDFTKLKEPFPEGDIEWRIQNSGFKSNGEPWAMVLAYVDARAVQNRLDEVVGPHRWATRYDQLDGGVLCELSINVDGQWVIKTDGSPETKVEAFKGGLSKALVRAASAWSIGRYLYKLDANFAKLSKEKSPGSNAAKIGDQWFYWTPPKLPAWALPGAKEKAPDIIPAIQEIPDQEPQKPKPVVAPLVAPKGSIPHDGANHSTLPSSPSPIGKKYDQNKPATVQQIKMVWAKLINELGCDKDQAKDFICRNTGKESGKDLTMEDINILLRAIDSTLNASLEPGSNG